MFQCTAVPFSLDLTFSDEYSFLSNPEMLPGNEVDEELKEFLFITGTKLALSYRAVVLLCNYIRTTFCATECIDKGIWFTRPI